MIAWILLILLIALLCYNAYRTFSFWRNQNVPTDYWLAIKQTRKSFFEADIESIKKHGKIVGFYFLNKPQLLIGDHELARQIFIKDFDHFKNRIMFCAFEEHPGEAVAQIRDNEWRAMRSHMSPAFTSRKLRDMQPLIEECTNELIGVLSKRTTEPEVDMVPRMLSLTVGVISSVAFGVQLDAITNPKSKTMEHFHELLRFDKLESLLIFAFPEFAFKVLGLSMVSKEPTEYFTKLSKDILRKRKAANDYSRKDMLNFLLESEMTEKQIIDNSIGLFVAAGETTAFTMSHTILELAKHPAIQDKLQQEIDAYFERTKEINYDTINELEYLDCIVKETLRLFATGSRSMRIASKNCMLGEVFVPKDTICWISHSYMHRCEENFERADNFIPERFEKDHNGLRHNDRAYIPFAEGPRNCLGERFALMEMKAVLIRLFREFRFERSPGTADSDGLVPGQIVTMSKKVLVKLVKRDLSAK